MNAIKTQSMRTRLTAFFVVMSIIPAAVLGAAIHSVAGLRAAEQVGKYGMLPRDLLDAIPQVLKEAENTI